MATGGEIETDKLSDETFDVLCSMCIHQDKNTEGVKFCIECDDYFCVKCVNIHSKVPSCVRHQLLDKAQVKTGTNKSLQRAPAERCARHRHKHIDMYCQNHDKVGCSTCLVVDHKFCKDVFYIPNYLKNFMHKVATAGIQTKLKAILRILEQQTDKYQKVKQKLLQRKSEILDDIRKFRKEINDQLDEMEKCSVAEIESKSQILEENIEEGVKKLHASEVNVSASSNKFTSPNINQADEFVFLKLGEEAADVAMECIERNKIDIKYKNLQFKPDQALITQLKKSKNFGMIQIDSLLQIERKKIILC